jgi:chromosome segregation ATPase
MKSTEQHIEDLHFEHKLWQSEANFYRDELKIYKEQVEYLSKRNSSSEVKDKVKYFKDQFEHKNAELTSLNQEIAAHEHDLASIEKNNFKGTGGEDTDEHGRMRKKFSDFKEHYAKLKKEFRLLLEEWM